MGYNDMHVHTASSPDAEIPAEKICSLAERAHIERIGFVAHLDLHPKDFCYLGFSEQGYLKELKQAERSSHGSIQLLRGIEIGEPHLFMDKASSLFSREEYDFITGALHWTGDNLILGEEPFLHGDPMALVEEYYRQTLEITSAGSIHILAHMGIFRRGMARAGLDTSFSEIRAFPALITKVLTAMIDNGIALEVNTAGLRRMEKVTYPALEIIEMYAALGGTRVTIGSDSHMERNLFFGLSRGTELLRRAGFDGSGFFVSGQYFQSPLHG